MRQTSLLFAGLALGEPSYLELWRKLPADSKVEEVIRNFFVRQPRSGSRARRVEPLERPPTLRVLEPERVEVGSHLVGGVGRESRERGAGAARSPGAPRRPPPSGSRPRAAAEARRGTLRAAPPLGEVQADEQPLGERSRRDRARWRGCGLARRAQARRAACGRRWRALTSVPDRRADQLGRRLGEEHRRRAQPLVGRQALPEARRGRVECHRADLSTSAADDTRRASACYHLAREPRAWPGVPDGRSARSTARRGSGRGAPGARPAPCRLRALPVAGALRRRAPGGHRSVSRRRSPSLTRALRCWLHPGARLLFLALGPLLVARPAHRPRARGSIRSLASVVFRPGASTGTSAPVVARRIARQQEQHDAAAIASGEVQARGSAAFMALRLAGVSIVPGSTALTRTPWARFSSASTRTSAWSATFETA